MEEYKKYEVHYLGKLIHYVNPELAKSMKLSEEALVELKSLHCDRQEFYERTEALLDEDFNAETRYQLLKEFREREFAMQRLWGFPEDEGFHRFWDIPSCTCPVLDNIERLGTHYNVYSDDCPLHGTII